jgi:RNA polymerase sigma-B factor
MSISALPHSAPTPSLVTGPPSGPTSATAAIHDSLVSRAERAQRTAQLLAQAQAEPDDDRRRALLEEVVVLNQRVAHAVARRYRGRGVSDDDLDQAACEGLVKAAAHFDPGLGHDFLSYAVPSIRGEVQRWFRDHSWTVRPPRRLQQLQWGLNHTVDLLVGELGRQPSAEETCAALDITREELLEVEACFGCFTPPSLDHPVGEGSATLADVLPGATDEALLSAEARVVLAPPVRRLRPRDRTILYLRFYEDRTQQEIADELCITQAQVSRGLSRILHDLQTHLEATG